MTLAVGQEIEVEVFVVLLDEPIAVVSGVLLWVGVERYRLRLDGARAAVGGRVLVTSGDERLPGRIDAVDGAVVSVARTEVHGADDRSCPRVGAQFPLIWSVFCDAPESRIPVGGPRAAISEGVSVSGLQFDVLADPPAIGDRLRIEATLAPGAGACEIGALVRRVQPIDAGWSIGVEFVEMDEATFDALTDLTLHHLA